MADLNQTDSDKFLCARLTDAARYCESGQPRFLGFLDERQQRVVRSELAKLHLVDCTCVFNGGFANAERTVLGLFPNGYDQKFPIKAINITYNSKFGLLKHGDFLGAMLALGIKRESTGDIDVSQGQAIVVVLEEIAPFILENLQKVGRIGVCLEIIGNFCYNKEDNFDCFEVNVASDRLDAVLAAVMRISREKAVQFLESGKAKLNHEVVIQKSICVKGSEILSITGYGRYLLDGYTGHSKKGRLFLSVKKYK